MIEGDVVREMRPADLPHVAVLHATSLPDDPASMLGVDFLAGSLYPTLLDAARCALVLEGSGAAGGIDGFVVVGGGNPLALSLRHRPLAFARCMGSAVLRRPAILRTAADVAGVVLRSPRGLPAMELQWIAIRDEARGSGAGSRLVASARSRLAREGVSRVWVKTLETTPENVAFYERNGFVAVARTRGRVYLVAGL